MIRSQSAFFSSPGVAEREAEMLATAEYRRQARRLRHRLQHDPVRLHQSLQSLSEQATTSDNSVRAVPQLSEHPLRINPALAATFTADIIRSLDGPVLRYSQRLALLRRAADLGISRFEANLLIAAVQHRCVTTSAPTTPNRANRLLLMAFAAGVQSLIAFLIWRLFA
ncbi:MAG: hypothetical protein ACM359_08870 [Bacillota bacterium]